MSATTTAVLDPTRIDSPDTLVRCEPFSFLVAHDLLPESAKADLDRDFPRHSGAGFFPYQESECGPSIRELIATVTAPAFADAVGAKLGIDRLSQYPTLAEICRYYNKRHGTIHTDSKSKVATGLIYLNAKWPHGSDGCLRFLAGDDDIDAVIAPESKPLYGEFVIFKRADNSFHGLLPYEGERRVIQIAWLTSEHAKQRKTQRGQLTRVVKKLAGSLDRKFGSGRDRNAAHLD